VAFSFNGGGGGGGSRRRFHGSSTLSDINVTPFVDVVLVLLIIFMMTAHVMESGIEVDVPKTTSVKESTKEMPVINITRDGRFFLGDSPVDNIHNLASEIRRRYRNTNAVYLRADKDTIWDVAVQVMNELGDAKFAVNVVTQPLDESDKRRR
jgi:biopolymer transport protein ExbD